MLVKYKSWSTTNPDQINILGEKIYWKIRPTFGEIPRFHRRGRNYETFYIPPHPANHAGLAVTGRHATAISMWMKRFFDFPETGISTYTRVKQYLYPWRKSETTFRTKYTKTKVVWKTWFSSACCINKKRLLSNKLKLLEHRTKQAI